MKINSANLAEASTLAAQIETLQAQLDEFNGKAQEVSKQLAPLQTKFQNLIGSISSVKVAKCAKSGRGKFTPEQKAKISAGLKAKWAERKAANSAAPAVPVASVVPATA